MHIGIPAARAKADKPSRMNLSQKLQRRMHLQRNAWSTGGRGVFGRVLGRGGRVGLASGVGQYLMCSRVCGGSVGPGAIDNSEFVSLSFRSLISGKT